MTQYFGVASSVTQGPLDVQGVLKGQGTTTNDSAAAGYIGEVLTATVASGAAVSLTTATAADVTTLSLTAGDWDVDGSIDYTLGAASTTVLAAGISATANTLPTQAGGSGIGTDPLTTNSVVLTTNTGTCNARVHTRISLAATTTIHLVASATFSAGTVAAFGTITARRAR